MNKGHELDGGDLHALMCFGYCSTEEFKEARQRSNCSVYAAALRDAMCQACKQRSCISTT
jgi:hypothetical protein